MVQVLRVVYAHDLGKLIHGIVSIASRFVGLPIVPQALFALNVAFYGVLFVLTILRILRYPRHVLSDLRDHSRSVGFFTIVAGTCVLGSQADIVGEMPRVALVLWCAGTALWALSTYAIFILLTVRSGKPTLAEGLNGAWLLAVVATQSVVVLGAQLAPRFGDSAPVLLFFCMAVWLAGGMLYLWIISLIFYRYMFFDMDPPHLTPPYWINMGAAAISTLAGTVLLEMAPHSPLLTQILPFVQGLTLCWWATATWWIPFEGLLGVWRHVIRRYPLRYDPLYWGAVFPLGMYAACTDRISLLLDARFLAAISGAFIWVALAAWAATAFGLLRMLAGRARPAG